MNTADGDAQEEIVKNSLEESHLMEIDGKIGKTVSITCDNYLRDLSKEFHKFNERISRF